MNVLKPARQTNPSVTGEDGSIKALSFTMPLPKGESEAEERNRAHDLRVCTKIADSLSALGFDTSKVGPAKPWGAAFSVRFDRFRIEVMFDAKYLPRFFKCAILSWASPSRWRAVSSDLVLKEWARLRNALEEIVRQDLKAGSLRWMSDDELAEEEEVERADFKDEMLKANC